MVDYVEFLRQRTRDLTLDNFEEGAKRALIELVASDVPLTSEFRRLIAGDLRNHFFPPKPHERRAARRQFEASLYGSLRQHLAVKFKQEGSKAPVADAECEIVRTFKLKSPEAFQRSLRRAKAEQRNKRRPDKDS